MNKLLYSLLFVWHLLLANATFAQGNTALRQAADEARLLDYFAQNHMEPIATPSGLYYTIKQQGTGIAARPGKQVTINYTGSLLNGKTFDSNIDPAFRHVQPLSFVLGTGRVIAGWDIGVRLLSPGAVATFYIPSSLAYGPKGSNSIIPPDAILVFDVELLNVQD